MLKLSMFEIVSLSIAIISIVMEHIVSTLKTIELKEEPYRAAEFGWTEEEHKQREEFSKQYKEQQKQIQQQEQQQK